MLFNLLLKETVQVSIAAIDARKRICCSLSYKTVLVKNYFQCERVLFSDILTTVGLLLKECWNSYRIDLFMRVYIF